MDKPRHEDKAITGNPMRPSPTPPRPEMDEEEAQDHDITPSPKVQTDPDRGIGEMGTEQLDPSHPLPKQNP